jgi:hypothetical protein
MLRIIFSIVALLCASIASAEPRTGTLIERTPHEVTTAFADSTHRDPRSVADRYARCLVEYDRPRADRFVGLPFLSPEQNDFFAQLSRASDECFLASDSELNLGILTIVGRIAEFKFERNYGSAEVGALVASASAVEPRSGMEDLAFCLVRADPAGAIRLIRTEIASREEKEAFNSIAGDLGPCLPAGKTFKLNVSATRDAYATGLYLLASRAKLAQAAP